MPKLKNTVKVDVTKIFELKPGLESDMLDLCDRDLIESIEIVITLTPKGLEQL